MDLIGIFVFGLGFLYSLNYSYEVWFAPEKYRKSVKGWRKSFKSIFGFSFGIDMPVNVNIARPASIFALIISFLGLISSIIGPIPAGR